ncbi:septum site-determining protein MinC [Sporosarcina sp. GW1-11]|uniref:septum site-determining protein MinC n=1 Tax=Sporosarcina sp. GW1-11 TaxID=2899126 RepID=UPI00294BB68D|nr:septum site-determining protein MinC [Sporosarcina sp. GW1-11]MDV6377218.1 septum site-determining protein MinC [Sporosarcina sp. GW1-11]
MTKSQLITIKGTKDGLVLRLDDHCSFSDLLDELKEKVTSSVLEGVSDVQLHTGRRFCDEQDMKSILAIIHTSPNLRVSKVHSDVISLEACEKKLIEEQSETYIGIVRSGQVVRAEGDLVIIGDVNQSAQVIAGGSIYVLGRVKGIAHAGANGNKDAVIAASWLEATHLKIADKMEIMTDELTVLSEQPEMECAYLHKNGQIAIDRLQELRHLRPNLATFKGGI